MTARIFLLLGLALLLAGCGAGETATPRRVEPAPNGAETVLRGRLEGRATQDYLVPVPAEGKLRVHLEADNRFAYFNLIPPGTDTALFVGSIAGHTFEGVLDQAGEYRVRVYLMPNAARREESTDYVLRLKLQS